jgi:hypothetical protein
MYSCGDIRRVSPIEQAILSRYDVDMENERERSTQPSVATTVGVDATDMSTILFLGGPSGAGKSFFASHCVATWGWLHLEIDRFLEGDGIDLENIRSEWDEFWVHLRARPLHNSLLARAGPSRKVVLSFPSNLIFSPEHLRAGQGYFAFAYLYGHPAHCLQAFLDREQATGRRLGAEWWNSNNHTTFGCLSLLFNHPLLIEAFTAGGIRRDPEQIYADVHNLIEKS